MVDSDEGYLTRGINSGTSAESASARLSAGNYLVRVRTDSSLSAEYQLRLVNETGSAVNVGNLKKDMIYKDVVGARNPADKTDYYRFEVKKASDFSAYLYGLTGDANVYLYPDYNDNGVVDSDEGYLARGINSGTSAESLSARLSAGNYLVRVDSSSPNSVEYQLRLANETGSAVNVGNLKKGMIYKDVVGARNPADRTDYYRFELKKTSDFSASLYGLTGDANVYLYPDYNDNGVVDSDEGYLARGINSGTSAESIAATLSAGKYLVNVYSSSPSSTEYQLRLVNEASGSENQGDIFEAPEKIPAAVEFPEERLKPVSVNDTPKGKNEAIPKIAVSNANITEGNKGQQNARFTVTLDNPSNETVRVNYATANQTAKANQDYKPTSGTLTFKPGQTRKTVTVPILGDTREESNEKFNLNLSKPRNGKLADRRGIATIRDNDKTPELSIGNASIAEGNKGRKNAKFAVTLDEASDQTVKVNYATGNGSAKAGKDYRKTNGTLTFKPGQTRKTITVPVFGDTLDEGNEKFNLNLSKPNNAKLGDRRGIGTIRDNDKVVPLISIGDARVSEGDDGSKQANFTVTLNAKSKDTVRVNYLTGNGTADAGEDYRRTNGTLTFKPGQRRKTITVPVFGDIIDEKNEKFKVTLRKPRNAKLGDKTGIGTIRDND